LFFKSRFTHLIFLCKVIWHTSSRKQSRFAPGWSEHVQPPREKSIFWYRLWVECGLYASQQGCLSLCHTENKEKWSRDCTGPDCWVHVK